jgi:hypothetical protein
MESTVVASKALVQVCVPGSNDSTSYEYTMDLSLDMENFTFHCRFRTNAHSGKKTFVYLFLDASHIQSLDICDIDEALPPSVMNAFSKRASSASSDGVTVLRFGLKSHAPLITPDSTLQKRPSTCDDLEALLRIGQCETFKVYVLSSAINRARLSSLCSALADGALQPAPEGVISNLYVNTSYRKVNHIDQLWSSIPIGSPPPYDPSTAPEASNDGLSGPSDPTPSNSSRAQGKRRSGSPDLHRTPSKRQLLTEKATLEPWQLAIAAQGAQIAALSAELSALREQVQQLQRTPGVNAETQTDPIVEHEPEAELEPSYMSHSQASTVENTIDDRLIMLEANVDERLKMLEENIIEEQTQRVRLAEKIENNNKEVCVPRIPFPLLPLRTLLHLFPSKCTVSSARRKHPLIVAIFSTLQIYLPSTKPMHLHPSNFQTHYPSYPPPLLPY